MGTKYNFKWMYFQFLHSYVIFIGYLVQTSSQPYWKPPYSQQLLYWESYDPLCFLREHFLS